MRILFCDDNQETLQLLQKLILEFFKGIGGKKPELVAYTSGDDLLTHESIADIAFLDVEMPGVSGITVGAKLKSANSHIKIFIVTSYPDYLDEAMKYQVFRYLSKPIDKNRLFKNMKDALFQYNIETKDIPVSTREDIIVLPAEKIICVETLQRKTYVYTDGGTIQANNGIEYWKSTLDLPCFYMTYRSFIVNMRYVYIVKKDRIILKYGKGLKEAYLARRKATDFRDTYMLFLENSR